MSAAGQVVSYPGTHSEARYMVSSDHSDKTYNLSMFGSGSLYRDVVGIKFA